MAENIPQSNNNPDEMSQTEQFLRLIMANQNRIYAFILTRVPNFSDADDIMQETAGIMWRKFSKFKRGTSFVSWGIRIAQYEIMKYRENNKHSALQFKDDVDAIILELAVAKNKEIDRRMEALKKCLTKLGQRERELIKMRYENNLTHKSVAGHIGVSIQAVSKTLSKVHDVLLRCIRRTLAAEEVT